MDTRNSALSRPVKAVLYLLLERPQAIPGIEVIDEPLPDEIVRSTIDVSLWSAAEKAKLMEHKAYAYYSFRLGADPVGDFLEAYRWLSGVEGLIGIANPNGATAHSAVWVRRLFEDGLDEVARQCPPLHLWTGLVPVQVEPSWEALIAGQVASLWLRTVGYGQFGLPDLAHPMNDLREAGWIHATFEGLFDWMYYEKVVLTPGMGIEVPERGRFVVGEFGVPGVLALSPYAESDSFSSAGALR
jgi:hypothetical protein